ncbi:YtxH domain-containing protein [Desemzia sp. FAM 23991]|uniref:YtxH domain-containing protein n=1 Tax=unclassified Desemzia TaxID=2685243 RepID=UPI003884E49C
MTKAGAFLKGAAIGAALGLLFAPKSGEELRKDLMKKREEAMGTAKGYADMAKEKGADLQQVAKDASDDIRVTLKDGYEEVKGQVQDTADQVKSDAEDAKDTAKETAEEVKNEAEQGKAEADATVQNPQD